MSKIDFDHPFWKRVDVRGPGECWPWTGYVEEAGYGVTSVAGLPMRAHRRAWQLAGKPERLQASGRVMCICHKCDNRACVNPRHLFAGTDAENAADMREKGRAAQGKKHWNAKLTEEQVRAIRQDPRPARAVAADYGVSRAAVSYARAKGWKSVSPE